MCLSPAFITTEYIFIFFSVMKCPSLFFFLIYLSFVFFVFEITDCTFLYFNIIEYIFYLTDRLCALVVRGFGYRYRGLGFNSRRYQIF